MFKSLILLSSGSREIAIIWFHNFYKHVYSSKIHYRVYTVTITIKKLKAQNGQKYNMLFKVLFVWSTVH